MAERNENILTNLGKQFLIELQSAVQTILNKSLGKDSDLSKSIEFIPQRNDTILMYANSYYQAVSNGRAPLKKKIPIALLLLWMKKNGITPKNGYSINESAYAIQTSIFKNGIRGKNLIEIVQNSVLDIAEVRIAEQAEDIILEAFAQITVK